MTPADESTPEDGEVDNVGGLLGELTAWHLRMLCESPWEGGGGYTPGQVGEMTQDQVWFRLCKLETLKMPVGGRVEKVEAWQATAVLKPDADGTVAGRDADGNPIRGRIGGESLARRLIREAEERKAGRKRRRRKRG
jgi:hypothetical protein